MILEIGDVSKEEALQYLKLRKVDDGQAAEIYHLVGGRMIHLKWVADEIQRQRTLQGMCIVCSIRNGIGFSPLSRCVQGYVP
jgi:hypothetical protein